MRGKAIRNTLKGSAGRDRCAAFLPAGWFSSYASAHACLTLNAFFSPCPHLQYGCLVVNAPTANTIAAAEHGIALLCAMARNVPQADASMKAGKWDRNTYVGTSLTGKTVAIIGFGKVCAAMQPCPSKNTTTCVRAASPCFVRTRVLPFSQRRVGCTLPPTQACPPVLCTCAYRSAARWPAAPRAWGARSSPTIPTPTQRWQRPWA